MRAISCVLVIATVGCSAGGGVPQPEAPLYTLNTRVLPADRRLEVSAIGPNQRVDFRIDLYLVEKRQFA